jgi:DNA/RNA-binding domain of Phe-tRNA-synthetase-like protein
VEGTVVTAISLAVAAEIAGIVAPVAFTAAPVVVTDRDPDLDRACRDAAARARGQTESAAVTAAVRAMYRAVGLDPTRTRPSSEALLRRVRRGDELPAINSLVDIVNWSSLESQLPFGLYDASRIAGAATLRLGRPGDAYPGIRKDVVHLDGRLALFDDEGPFGNPTSDSARTMVTSATTAAWVVIFAPAALPASQVAGVAALAQERITRFASPKA